MQDYAYYIVLYCTLAYCLKHKTPCSYYHHIHIHQLNVLHKITGENIFKEWALKFEKKSIIK